MSFEIQVKTFQGIKNVKVNMTKVFRIIYFLKSDKRTQHAYLAKTLLKNGDEQITIERYNTWNGNIEHYSPITGQKLDLNWSMSTPVQTT